MKISLNVKHGNSKLHLKSLKPALESSFYMKIKNESSRLIGMVRMIEYLSSMLLPYSNLAGISKNHEVIVFVII